MTTKALVVSGDQEFLSTVPLAFRKERFFVVAVASAEEARLVMSREPLGAVMIDEDLKDARGVDLLVEFAKDYPDVLLGFATSRVDLEVAFRLVNQAKVFRVFRKPWDTDALGVGIRAALRRHNVLSMSDRVVNLARRQTVLVEDLDREAIAGGEPVPGGTAGSFLQQQAESHRALLGGGAYARVSRAGAPQGRVPMDEIDPVAMLPAVEAASLSRREKDLLRAFISGKKPAELARTFFISVHTARNHVKAIYRKLGVNSQGALFAKVLRPSGHGAHGTV